MKKKILIVVANYYKNIADSLLHSAKNKIKNKCSIKVINVPGVFEIPVTISKNLNKNSEAYKELMEATGSPVGYSPATGEPVDQIPFHKNVFFKKFNIVTLNCFFISNLNLFWIPTCPPTYLFKIF